MTAQELRDQFESDLLKLQEVCLHKMTTLCDYQFAPGHSTGTMVLVCDCCEKILETHDQKIPRDVQNLRDLCE